MKKEEQIKILESTRNELWNWYLKHPYSPEHRWIKKEVNSLYYQISRLKKGEIDLVYDAAAGAKDALKVLEKVKARRANKKFELVKINSNTWKEVEIKTT